METITKDNELFEWLREFTEAYRSVRGTLEREFAECMLRVEGIQWLDVSPVLNRVEQIRRSLDLDNPNFRPVLNRTARFVQRIEAATSVRDFDCEVQPPERDVGVTAPRTAQVFEDLANVVLKDAGLVQSWNVANYQRCVTGSWGIGLFLRPSGGDGDGIVRAFDFNPVYLTVDPANTCGDLDQHDCIMYSSAWSLSKLRRTLGDKALADAKVNLGNDQDFKMLKDLMPFEAQVNRISNGRLFSAARLHSTTRGVIVHEIYRKVASMDRFDTMEIVLELPGRKHVLVNQDNRESPWGGCGMALRLLHGYRRSESIWSIGDAKMMKDDQDQLNHVNLMKIRQLRSASKDKWIVDTKAFGTDNSPESVAQRFSTMIHGIIPYDSGSEGNRAQAPQYVPVRAPDQWLSMEDDRITSAMREQIHRAAIHQGQTTSHTPLGAYKIALEEAGQPADQRIFQDRKTAESLVQTMLCTCASLVASGAPAMSARLVSAGFDDLELGTIARAGVNNGRGVMPYRVMIREGSIRQRSFAARMQSLREDATAQLISPRDYQRVMAESGIDMPISDDDATFARWSARQAEMVMRGMEFVPLPLGPQADYLIAALTRAMVDRRCDAEGRLRLANAIEQQRLKSVTDEAVQQGILQPPTGQTGQAGSGGQTGGGINDILAALDSQLSGQEPGGGVAA